jgi:hypothetical protein
VKTRIVEAEHGGRGNHGKFLLGRFTDEWEYRSALEAYRQDGNVPPHLLGGVCGWGAEHVLIVDLATGEGALFLPGGHAGNDLDKRRIWVCPLFEPFVEFAWQWVKDGKDLWDLPPVVLLPDAPFAVYGYRRPGRASGGDAPVEP